jgi:hypothetical protein
MNKWHGALAAAAALIAVGCGAGSSAVDSDAKQAKPAAVADDDTVPTPDETQTTAPVTVAPKPSDFTMTVKTTKKQCFGTAGCNVTYHVEVSSSYIGAPDKEWLITYEVRGGEDVSINSFTYTGTKYTRDQEEFVQVPSSKSKLTAKATEVAEN